jgi:D-hydroxyproline dehydrogenase subunit alpha
MGPDPMGPHRVRFSFDGAPLEASRARIRQVRQVRHLAATTVWRAARDDDGVVTLWVGGPEGGAETTVEVRAVVLATGAAELVLPFPGWDLPGVTTAGAAAALLAGQGVTVGRRVLMGGSGPQLLPVAARLAQAGVRVVAVLEATPAPATLPQAAGLAAFPGQRPQARGYAAVLARHGVPVRTGYAVVACQGTERVGRAVIAQLDQDWRPLPGSRREETVDAVHVGFGFSPALELPRALGCAEVQHASRPAAAVACDADLATSVPGVFAAGQVTGAGGADVAELEGYLAGTSAARYLSRLPPDAYAERTRPLRARLEQARRLAAQLGEAYPLPPGWLEWPDADTVICRCEQTRWSEIGAAVDGGARDVSAVMAVTRCGTGDCRARVCGPALRYAVSAAAASAAAGGQGGRHPLRLRHGRVARGHLHHPACGEAAEAAAVRRRLCGRPERAFAAAARLAALWRPRRAVPSGLRAAAARPADTDRAGGALLGASAQDGRAPVVPDHSGSERASGAADNVPVRPGPGGAAR